MFSNYFKDDFPAGMVQGSGHMPPKTSRHHKSRPLLGCLAAALAICLAGCEQESRWSARLAKASFRLKTQPSKSSPIICSVLLLSVSATAQRGNRGHRGHHGHTYTTHHRTARPVYRAPASAPRPVYRAPVCAPVYRRPVVRSCAPARVWVPRARIWDAGCGAWVWQPGFWRYY